MSGDKVTVDRAGRRVMRRDATALEAAIALLLRQLDEALAAYLATRGDHPEGALRAALQAMPPRLRCALAYREAEEDEERPDPDKRRATDWESAASYVSTFPDGDGEGACDVQVQVGFDEDSGAWRVLVEAALRVVRQFIRTKDDAGGSDEAPDTSYDSEDDACQAAKDFAEEHDEGDGTEDAEGYLRRQLEESADEGLDPEGGWRIWWDTTGSGSGPRGPRYATCAAAEAAAKLANEELSDTPGGNLLCGFAVAFLDEDGDWRRFDPERDAYTRG